MAPRTRAAQLADRGESLETVAKKIEVPEHIAIVMDGNGRWATQRGLPRLGVIPQQHRYREHHRQQELRRDAMRPAAPEGHVRERREEHGGVDVGQVGGDGQREHAEACPVFQPCLAKRRAHERVADVVHQIAAVESLR